MDEKLGDKVSRAAIEAARRKFTPEFMNRIDRTVVFHPLGVRELRRILEIELNEVQQRIFKSPDGAAFMFSLSDPAKDFLLREGTDMKYGARHLKRAIDRNLVHPLSNLIASDQVRGGDLIRVGCDDGRERLTFFKEAENMPAYAMMEMMDLATVPSMGAVYSRAVVEMPRGAGARLSRR